MERRDKATAGIRRGECGKGRGRYPSGREGDGMEGFKRVEEKTSTVAGAPARSVTFTGSMFVPLKITYTEVFGPDFTHVITWWAVKNNYDSLLPEYMKFMETFRFLD